MAASAEPELILCAVRWHLRYSLSFRDVEELLSERGQGDHQHRPGTPLRLGDFRNEKRRNPAALLPPPAKEGTPGRAALALWSWLDAVGFENVANRGVRDVEAQVG